ncbi:MAG: hypothetical protein KKE98_00885 [Nanoarchaeota archaeon]|nr:hypothetical protein [Nanoarchaeota archaeon]MBU1596974.1 hypothetical protein [Nanoarchaeota archaeon]MBU2441691.1 hypothetical protein [Nanoarchaeota archaeon]
MFLFSSIPVMAQEQKSTFAEDSIKQKAIDVARQIEIYLHSYPDKTLKDLQDDAYFQEIAVQPVGKTGYTAITDYETLTCRFHKNPAIVDVDLSNLAEKLPGFWGVMSRTKGGVEADGVYDWEEADGSIKQKYMYIAIVNAKTADDVGLHIAATTYLDEYEEKSIFSKEEEKEKELFNLNYIYLIIAVVGLLIYLFCLFSIKKEESNKSLKFNFIMFIVSAMLLLVTYVVRLHVFNLSTSLYLMRLVIVFVYLFVFYYMLSAFAVAKHEIKKPVLLVIYLVSLVVAVLVMFTKLFVKEAIINPDVMAKYGTIALNQGILFPVALLVLVVYVVISFAVLLIGHIARKDKKLKFFILAFLLSALMVIPHALSTLVFNARNPIIPLIFPIIMAGLFAGALFKFGFLKQKTTTALIILTIFAVLLIGIFLLNAYFTSENMKAQAQKSMYNSLTAVAVSKANHIGAILESYEERSNLLTSKLGLRIHLKNYLDTGDEAYKEDIRNNIKEVLIAESDIKRISIVGLDGQVISSTESDFEGKDVSDNDFFINGKKRAYISEFVVEKSEPVIHVSGPLILDGELIGVVVAAFEGRSITNIMQDASGLGETVVSYLINKESYIISHSRFIEDALLKQKVDTINSRNCLSMETHPGEHIDHDAVSVFSDYRGVPVFRTHVYIPEMQWCLLVEIEEEEFISEVSKTVVNMWLFTFVSIISIIIVGLIAVVLLTKNLRKEVLLKTKEINVININLEKTVKQRTNELEKLTHELEHRVEQRTKELNKKISELEDTRTAILNILEDVNLSKEELEKSQKEILKINQDIKKTNIELQKMDKTKTEFISVTAHELKTPLTSIHGFASLLQNKKILENKKQREYYLSIIMEDADRLKKLINDILDLSRLDLGTMKFMFEEINVRDALKSLVKELYIAASKKGLVLKADAASNVPNIINADKSRLIQVLANLVNNAINYSPKKGSRIIVSASRKGSKVMFSVKDTGTGIPKNSLNKIFRRFYQVDSSYTRKVGGTGLGLAICKGIVEAMGGKLWVTSTIGRGSTFYFTVPIHSKMSGEEDLQLFKKDKKRFK